jgi:hypothetical protein
MHSWDVAWEPIFLGITLVHQLHAQFERPSSNGVGFVQAMHPWA